MEFKIRNFETGERLTISRDVTIGHPQWVHAQCGTESEGELQDMLDQMSYTDFAGKGEDCCGIYVEAPTASDMGKKGGRSRSAKKLAAVRENGKKGGRPKGHRHTPSSDNK